MKNRSGFTLIELMVVIVIMGVLSLIGVNAFTSSQVRSRDAKRKADLENFQKSLEFYYNDYQAYPDSNANGEVICQTDPVATCPWGNEFSDELGTVYMTRLPKEANPSYRYFYVSAGSDYKVYALLENSEDADIPDEGSYIDTDCSVAASVEECNYGVASVNTTP